MWRRAYACFHASSRMPRGCSEHTKKETNAYKSVVGLTQNKAKWGISRNNNTSKRKVACLEVILKDVLY